MDQVRGELPRFEESLNRKVASAENPLPLPYGPPSATDKASFAVMQKRMQLAVGGPPPEAELHETYLARPDGGVGPANIAPEAPAAISKSYERFTEPIPVPILAIMGYPQSKGSNFRADTPKNIAAAAAADANQARQIDAFERGQPTAHVIRIPNANHYIFISNEPQVFDEMSQFLNGLEAPNARR